MREPGALRKAVAVAWPPVSVIVLHQLCETLLGHQESLDPLFHFAGGVAGAYAVLLLLTYPPSLPRAIDVHRYRIAVGAVTVAALLWEFGEFLSDQFRGTHIQMGPLDTWSDIALGIAGAVVCTLIWRSRARAK